MTGLAMIAAAVAAIGIAEAAAAALVHWLKRRCQWLVTTADLDPPIDRAGLERFLAHGWDAEIGWVRKPNTQSRETGKGGAGVVYRIDATGARRNPGFEGKPPVALVYGDSYAFCRQVEDGETWPHALSTLLGGNVANHGVGNYGLDQALLRLEREFDRHPAGLVLMAVVPETICRVLGVWRHFSEYGNVFAFKPRFGLDGDRLRLVPNPASTPDRFLKIAEMLPALMRQDFFYARKFAPDLLRAPYLWHLWRSRRRNLPLLAAALSDRLGGDGKNAFCRVLERNIRLAAELYREAEPLDLMVAIARRFAEFAAARATRPVLVLLPQLFDLEHLRRGDHYYAPLVESLRDVVATVDLGPAFAAADDAANFIDDRYGGHLSARGNAMAARILADRLRAEGIADGRTEPRWAATPS